MPVSAPDGGYGWVVALCSMCIMFLHSSFFSVFGVVYMEMVMYYETSMSAISWVGAILQFVFGVAGFTCGPLARKYGPRRVGLITPFIVTIGYICPVFSSHLWTVFVSYTLFVGCGLGFFSNIAVSTVYPWFSKRRSLAISLVMMGVPFGAFVWPPFVTWLNHEYSWKGAFIIVGGVHLQALVFIALLRNPDGTPSDALHHVKCDIPVFNNNISHKENDFEQKEIKSSLCSWTELCKDPSFPMLYICSTFLHCGHIVGYSYTTARGLLMGFADTDAALLSSIVGGVGGAGRLLAGILGVRFGSTGRKYAMVASLMTCGLTSILSMFCVQYWHMAIYCAMWGLFSGSYTVYLLATYADLFGTKYATELIGMNQAVAGVAFLSANILTGVIFDKTDDPSLPFSVFGGMQMMAGLIGLLAILLKKKK